MVLAERHAELLRNGRRSRGPSPNGHNGGSPDTSSDEDNSIKRNGKTKAKQSEYEEKIRVGRDYQAVCPELIPAGDRKPELLNDRALLVWSPTKDIPDCKLEEYISVAKEKYGYNGEQALGMLFWHKHDLERAVMDLANFTPFPDEWTVEDKVLFEQAFQFHGKSFHRIRQMLPDKSIASLVKYYYSWKKTRHRQSVMDRQEKAKASKDGSENGSENGSNEESENDDKVQQNKQAISALKRKISESCEDLRPIEQPNRINSRWSNEELSMAVHGVKKFGKDFQAIAEMLGTKTEAHVRTFFVNYRRRYNLDNVLKEFEAERATNQPSEEEKPQEAKNSDEKISEKDITENKEDKKEDDIIIQKSNLDEIDDKNIALLSNNMITNDEFNNINDSTIDNSVPEKIEITPQINSTENVIMEIDLDSEASESSSPTKKIKTSETAPVQIKL